MRPEGARLPTRCLLRRCPNLRRLPEDIDEWTIEDLRGLVVNPAPAFPAESPETKLQVTLADFRGYLESVGNPYRYLTANRPAAGGCNGDGGTSSSAQDTPSLAGVPEICFRNDFDLAQPDTFAFFSPPEQPHATMVMLERLAQWLDQVVAAPPAPRTPSGHVRTSPLPCQPQVELTLLNEVSTRSDGFFEALESYDHLSQQVALGRSQIEALRLRIRALEVNLVEKSLSLPRLVRQRANTAALHAKLRLVHAVWRTQPTIQQLLAAGDFPGALELITSSQQLLDTGALPNHPRESPTALPAFESVVIPGAARQSSTPARPHLASIHTPARVWCHRIAGRFCAEPLGPRARGDQGADPRHDEQGSTAGRTRLRAGARPAAHACRGARV